MRVKNLRRLAIFMIVAVICAGAIFQTVATKQDDHSRAVLVMSFYK